MLFCISIWIFCFAMEHNVVHCQNAFVLIGATGNLAEKYIWNSVLHELFISNESTYSLFYGAASSNFTVGSSKLPNVLKRGLKCAATDSHCLDVAADFIEQVKYVQLSSKLDYQYFCHSLFLSSVKKVVFYLSLPPSANLQTLSYLWRLCRKFLINIFVEKPFATSFTEMQQLVNGTFFDFKDNEIFFVDHYLGKKAFRDISLFRQRSKMLASNLHSMQFRNNSQIEIALLESDPVPNDRLKTYDKLGALKDMLSSHATTLLTSILCANLLADICFSRFYFCPKRLFLAQNEDYRRVGSGNSSTNTFAMIRLDYVDEYLHVPVRLISGKYLPVKIAYVKLAFTNSSTVVFVVNPEPLVIWSSSLAHEMFVLHSSADFGSFNFAERSKNICSETLLQSLNLTGICQQYLYLTPDTSTTRTQQNVGAYNYILRKSLISSPEDKLATLFLSKEHVLSSWRFWQKVFLHADRSTTPVLYKTGELPEF